MRTIETVLLVEGNPGDARLLREVFDEDSLDVDLICFRLIADARSCVANEFRSMTVNPFRGVHGT
jgi:hypothetical protein